jgi:hypothetical protein
MFQGLMTLIDGDQVETTLKHPSQSSSEFGRIRAVVLTDLALKLPWQRCFTLFFRYFRRRTAQRLTAWRRTRFM